jgi:hypothetical protein
MEDSTYKIMPIYAVQGEEAQHVDAEIKELGVEVQLRSNQLRHE